MTTTDELIHDGDDLNAADGALHRRRSHASGGASRCSRRRRRAPDAPSASPGVRGPDDCGGCRRGGHGAPQLTAEPTTARDRTPGRPSAAEPTPTPSWSTPTPHDGANPFPNVVPPGWWDMRRRYELVDRLEAALPDGVTIVALDRHMREGTTARSWGRWRPQRGQGGFQIIAVPAGRLDGDPGPASRRPMRPATRSRRVRRGPSERQLAEVRTASPEPIPRHLRGVLAADGRPVGRPGSRRWQATRSPSTR